MLFIVIAGVADTVILLIYENINSFKQAVNLLNSHSTGVRQNF